MKNVLIAIVTLALYFCRCGADQAADKPAPETKSDQQIQIVRISRTALAELNLRVEPAERKKVQSYLNVPATLKCDPSHVAQIGSPVNGQVKQVMVDVGSRVRKGQVLATLIGQEFGDIVARYLQAQAQLVSSRTTLDRQTALQQQNATALKSLQEAQSDYDKAKAQFDAEHSRLHAIGMDEQSLDQSLKRSALGSEHSSVHLPIRSPISGTVIRRDAVMGQNAEPGQVLFEVVDPSKLWAEGFVHENDWSKITAPAPVQFFSAGRPDDPVNGMLAYVAPLLDAETHTALIRAAIPNDAKSLAPNMYGRLRVPLAAASQGIAIPNEAIIEMDQQSYVFIAQQDTLFELRPVQRGLASDSLAEIKAGLAERDRVVVKGAFILKSELLKSAFAEEGE